MSGLAVDLMYDAATELLDAIVDGLNVAGLDEISRVYVSPGPPAFDCEQLTVHCTGPAMANTLATSPVLQPAHRMAQMGMVFLVGYDLTLLRCIHSFDTSGGVTVPQAVELQDDARLLMRDLYAIWNHVKAAKRANTLFPPKSREFYMDQATPIRAQGGLAGWRVPFRVQVDGYKA